ncbi:unnamed protein product [Ectocarpus sp. CCAP 1310/34]|nr:unnamed protein product [Ectocarpus sp. CCAP 1310/34]
MRPPYHTSLHCCSPHVTYTQVVAAPDAGTSQVQAAQNFKELSDKVANARGDSRGKKRSPKGQAAAARGRRLGRGGSKPPSPSSRGGGRRRSSVLPRAGGGGGGSSNDGDDKHKGRSSRSSRASFSQQRRRSVRSSKGSNSISGSKNSRSSAQREAVESSGGEGGGQQIRSAESSSEAGLPPLLIDRTSESMNSQEEPAAKGVEVSDTNVVAQDRSQGNNGARKQQHPGGNGNGTQDDAVEQSDVTGMGQRQDGAPGDTSAVEETLVGNALDGETVPTRPPLQGAASTSDLQDGSEISPPGPPSSATVHTKQEEDSGLVDLEGSGITGSSPNETEQHDQEREEEQLQPWPEQHEEVPEEDGVSLSAVEEAGEAAAEAGFLEGIQEEAAEPKRGADGGDGGAGVVHQHGPAATAAIDFVPTERSLAAYCQAAARCKLAIEAFEASSSSDSSSELDSDSGDDDNAASENDKHKQRLVERYADLTDAMMDWGVEAAQALLVEVTKTAAKHRTISAWTNAVLEPGRDKSSKRGGGLKESQQARQDRATLLQTEKAVLHGVVEALGGWEAAVFLDSGVANLDVDVAAWPIEDQLAILTALNDHLRDELEEKETRHDLAVGDILGRFHAAQKELEQLRSERELHLSTVKDVAYSEHTPREAFVVKVFIAQTPRCTSKQN